jgi:hypothetical protein
VPQYSRRQLGAALGREREGTTRLPVGIGCLAGLVLGIAIAVVADRMGWLLPGERVRYQLHAEIVLMLGLAGLIIGQIVALLRLRRARGAAAPRRPDGPQPPQPGDQT